jgi:hypothetical protein
MKRSAVVLAGLAVCAAGCGAQHHDSLPPLGSTVAAPPVTAPATTDSAALQALLLTAADLPPGFTQLDDAGAGNGTQPADRSRTDPAACANVLAPVGDQVPGGSAHAAVHYSDPHFAGIDIDITSYPNGAAAQAFSTVQALLHQCRSYSGTDADGTAIDYLVGGLDQPRAGDASASFQVRTTSQGMTLYSAATVAVTGSDVVQIADTAPQPIDPNTLRDLTAKQVRRLQGIAGP